MAKVYDIRAGVLQKASADLAPELSAMFEKYGLDITLTLLLYYTARGAVGNNGFSEEQKQEIVDKCKRSFDACVKLVRSELQGGPGDK